MFLASKSPQRKALLESLGIDFEIIVPDYREVDPPGASSIELVERHSCGKAMSVLPSIIPLSADRPLLGVDTMVVIDGKAVGKAADEDEARGYLKRMSGETHEVVSGITLIWAGAKAAKTNSGENAHTALKDSCGRLLAIDNSLGQIGLWRRTGHSITRVRFSIISDAELDAYLATGEWRGRAGAYAIQERASAFVEEIHGDYTNVVGLPVPLLAAMLDSIGCWPPPSWTSEPGGDAFN